MMQPLNGIPGYGMPGYGLPAYGQANTGRVPPYPGTPAINADPRFQYNPQFNGSFTTGLTTNPILNAQMDDLNLFQNDLFAQSGLGYPIVPQQYPQFTGYNQFPPYGAPYPNGINPIPTA